MSKTRTHESSVHNHALHEHTPRRRQRRSASPRVFTTPSPHPTDKGVKNMTLKVIKRLENLGHLDEQEESEKEEGEVEDFLKTSQRATTPIPPKTRPAIAKTQKKKIDWEVPRKVFHSSMGQSLYCSVIHSRVVLNASFVAGFLCIYLYMCQGSSQTVVNSLWIALAIIAPADFLRLRYPSFERVYEKVLGFLMRESEKVRVVFPFFGVSSCLTSRRFIPASHERRHLVHSGRKFRLDFLPTRCCHSLCPNVCPSMLYSCLFF